MGAVFERNQTTGATVLRAMICPVDYYGVVGVVDTKEVDSVAKKYGRVATPCTQCPTNMVTSGSDASMKVPKIKAIDPDNGAIIDLPIASNEGYYTVDSCVTKPGYGKHTAVHTRQLLQELLAW
jgi:hypothetical protein